MSVTDIRWQDKPNRHAYCDGEIARLTAERDELRAELARSIAGAWTGDATRRVAEISADNAMLRGVTEAARHFAVTWRDTLPELPDSYTCTYTCAEANAAEGLYRALGDDATADAIIRAHAAYDEEGDQHYLGPRAGTAIAAAGTEHLAGEQP